MKKPRWSLEDSDFSSFSSLFQALGLLAAVFLAGSSAFDSVVSEVCGRQCYLDVAAARSPESVARPPKCADTPNSQALST